MSTKIRSLSVLVLTGTLALVGCSEDKKPTAKPVSTGSTAADAAKKDPIVVDGGSSDTAPVTDAGSSETKKDEAAATADANKEESKTDDAAAAIAAAISAESKEEVKPAVAKMIPNADGTVTAPIGALDANSDIGLDGIPSGEDLAKEAQEKVDADAAAAKENMRQDVNITTADGSSVKVTPEAVTINLAPASSNAVVNVAGEAVSTNAVQSVDAILGLGEVDHDALTCPDCQEEGHAEEAAAEEAPVAPVKEEDLRDSE